jgi:hypothetical protein
LFCIRGERVELVRDKRIHNLITQITFEFTNRILSQLSHEKTNQKKNHFADRLFSSYSSVRKASNHQKKKVLPESMEKVSTRPKFNKGI